MSLRQIAMAVFRSFRRENVGTRMLSFSFPTGTFEQLPRGTLADVEVILPCCTVCAWRSNVEKASFTCDC